jgi:tetratricopeptide (TPR) repeat protein
LNNNGTPYHLFVKVLIICFLFSSLKSFEQNVQHPVNQAQQQRMIDESLAGEFFRSFEYDKALEIFGKLYDQYKTQYYFSNYVNCLIQLNRLKEAEQSIKKQIRGSGSNLQMSVDLAYIYQLMGDKNKASRAFEKIIDDLPADINQINMAANAFRSRNLDDYAMKVYEKGGSDVELHYPFYLEKAGMYQLTGDLSKSIDNYLLYLDFQPDHIDLVKNRFQNLLLADGNENMSDLLRMKLLTHAQTEPENETYSKLLIWHSLQQNDFDIAMNQAMAIDRRLGDREAQIIELTSICIANQQFETALNGFNYITKKGRGSAYYFNGLTGSLKSKYLLAQQQHITDQSYFSKLSADITSGFEMMGWNRETWELATIQAQLLAYKLNQADEATKVLEKALTLPLQPIEIAEIKMYLADILLFKNDVWEATLLYSQVEKSLKNEPIAHEAKFRNARLRYFIGEYAWSVTMLDVLKAATSKLIANDALGLSMLIHDFLIEDTTGFSLIAFAKADLLIFQKKEAQSLIILDSLMLDMKSAAMQPYFLMRKAEIYDNLGMFNLADSAFKEVYTRFNESYQADDAILRRAMLNELKMNNQTEAQFLYEMLFEQYPSSIFANDARRKYRLLRGDTL